MTDPAALFTAKTPPGLFAVQAPSVSAPLGSAEGSGAISGGLLRPGSIDQASFLQMLRQQQQNRQAAGVGGKAVAMPAQSFQPASAPAPIPTLSSAQFAALVGAQSVAPSLATAAVEGSADDPQALAANQPIPAAAQLQARAASSPSLKLSGSASRNAPSVPLAGKSLPAEDAGADAPTIARRATPQQIAAYAAAPSGELPSITRKSAPVLEASASASAEKTPNPE